MMSLIFRRAKSDIPAISSDLNKKILEAFTSIIDKGAKISPLKAEPLIESIPRYNLDSSRPGNRVDFKSDAAISLQYQPESLLNCIPPDIFRRKKMPVDSLHKNIFLMTKMLSPSGSMLPKSFTKLSSKTHRHLSKVVRRARQMGILPYMYRPKVNYVKI